jgi:hypothetical protein
MGEIASFEQGFSLSRFLSEKVDGRRGFEAKAKMPCPEPVKKNERTNGRMRRATKGKGGR